MRAIRLMGFACAAAGLFSCSARADISWGVNGHALVSYPGVSFEQQLDYVNELGMTAYRVDVTSPDQAGSLRRLVDAARSRNITILPVITPLFDLEREDAAALEAKSFDFARRLVGEFKDDIHIWELANELENYAVIQPCENRDDGTVYGCEFGAGGGASALDYYGPRWTKVAAVLKGLTAGCYAADPTVKRAIGTAGWGHTGAFERMKKDGVAWEISVWHTYGEDPEWALKILAQYDRPIWITEFNHPRGSQKSAKEQADGISQIITRLRQLKDNYNVEFAFVYELLDESYWAPNYEAYMGLVGLKKSGATQWASGERKLAFDAVRKAVAWTADGTSPPPALAKAPTPALPKESVAQAALRTCDLDASLDDRPPAEQVVSYAYCLALGRRPDGAGLQGWTKRLSDYMPASEIVLEMLQSGEFAHQHDLARISNSDFCVLINLLLFDKTLSRAEADQDAAEIEKTASGRRDYVRKVIASEQFARRHPILFKPLTGVAKSAPKPEVRRFCQLKPLAASEATKRALVGYSYCLVLGRVAEAYGLRSYMREMDAGLTTTGLIMTLLQSAEFEMKYATAAMDNESYVTFAYRLLLNRDPDGAGLANYVSGLSTGQIGRPDLYSRLIASDEFHAAQSALFPVPEVQGDAGKPTP